METPDDLKEVILFTYVFGILDGLRDKGLVKGGMFSLTKTGKDTYLWLREHGFTATNDEINRVMTELMNHHEATGKTE